MGGDEIREVIVLGRGRGREWEMEWGREGEQWRELEGSEERSERTGHSDWIGARGREMGTRGGMNVQEWEEVREDTREADRRRGMDGVGSAAGMVLEQN
ncbi:unnamed protein product [Calypogeia fissa]